MNNSTAQGAWRRSVISGIRWSYISAAVNAVLHIVVLSMLAHLLDPRAFGLLGLALIFTNIAERFGQLGVGPTLVQREHLDEAVIDVGHTLSIALGLFVCGVLWFSSPAIAEFFREPELAPILRVLTLMFLVESAATVGEALLTRDLKFGALAVVENASYFIGLGCVAVGLSWAGYGVWALVFGQVVARLVKLALILVFNPRPVGFAWHTATAKALLFSGAGFSAGRLLNFAALHGDNFIVGKFLNSTALGLYSRAYQLMTLPATYVAQVLDKVLFPALAKRQSEQQKLSDAFIGLVEIVGVLSLPLSAGVVVGAPEIVSLLLGDHWLEAVPVLQLFGYGIFFRAAYKCGDTIARSMGAVYRHASLQAVYAGCVVLAALAGIPFGLEGVAAGVLGAIAVNYLLMSRLAMSLLQMSWKEFIFAHFPGLYCGAATLVASFCALHLSREYGFSPFVSLLFAGICSLLAVGISWRGLPVRYRGRGCQMLMRQSINATGWKAFCMKWCCQ